MSIDLTFCGARIAHRLRDASNEERNSFSAARVTATITYHLSLPWGDEKRQNTPRVKDWGLTIEIFALFSASLALAEDLKTVSGRVYKDATISRVEADGIVIRTKTGISKVYFVELPK